MNQAIGGSSTISLTQGAQSEAQPFFKARIFPLPEQVASSSSSSASTSSSLSALRLSLLAEWQRFHSAPLPHGAGGYVFYHSSPRIAAHPGAAPSSKNKHPLPPHLTFDLRTGSATEDEFLLVHFLRLQQRRGALLERCAIQLKDEDGDFLLIEAAEELEDWIDPDNAPGRSWLLKEQLVIIPPPLRPDDNLNTPGPLEDTMFALKYLDEQDELLRPSEALNAAAFARLSSYPTTEWLDTIQHRTTIYLPSRQIANILEQNPQLIARAGQAFLGRDTQDMRRASRMDKFLPVEEPQKGQIEETPTKLFVLAITLPRRLYAQLLSARFLPPKTFPSPYRDCMSHFWKIIDDMSSLSGEGSAETAKEVDATALDDGRRYDLGCKLVLGLEMAFWVDRERLSTLSRSKGGSIFNSQVRDSETETTLSGPAYEVFLSKLSQLGFFQDEIRGSAKWKELEAQAIRDWRSGDVKKEEDANDSEDDDTDGLAWVQSIDQLSAVSTSQAILATDQPAFSVLEQSDSWLYDGGASFLEKGEEDDVDAEQEASRRLNEFASKVEKFVQGKGEVQGAVVDESDSEDDDDDGSEGDVDTEAVVSQARKELNRLTPAEREAKLNLLLPRLGQPVEWGDKSATELDEAADRVEQSQGVEAAIEIEEQRTKEQAFKEATKLEPLPKILDSSSRQALSSNALRASMQQQAFKSNNNFDGAESFHLDATSDDDSEAGLDENGQPETMETRQKRAELLGLDWEEDEEEDFEAEQNPSRRRRLDEAEEMQEFLEFARQELGLSEAQLEQILNDRRDSGRWVPGMEGKPPQKPVKSAASTDQEGFGKDFSKGFLAKKVPEPRSTPAISQPGSKKVTFADASADDKPSAVTDKADSRQEPTLDSFDTLMAAMDSSLDAHRRAKGLPPLDRQQAYGGEVTAEDWALRRPGGASLGSVMMKQQQEEREKSAKPEENAAPPATETVPEAAPEPVYEQEEDMADDEDLEPLSAKDEDRLHRLLAGQDEKKETFDEMVESARQQRRDRGATDPSILDTADAFERPEAAKITELFHNSDGAKEGDDEEMPDLEVDSDAEMEGDDGVDEKVMGNLLESWRAQGGNAGPMSTLAGGMGFGTQAPRR